MIVICDDELSENDWNLLVDSSMRDHTSQLLFVLGSREKFKVASVEGTNWAYNTRRPTYFEYMLSDDNVGEEDADFIRDSLNPDYFTATFSERNDRLDLVVDFSKKLSIRGFNVLQL